MHRLNKLTQSILAQELNKAFFRTGKRLLTMYLEQMSETQALSICQSPSLLRDTIEKILSDREAEAMEHGVDPPLKILRSTRTFPRQATREIIRLVEETIHNSPLDGLTIDDVLKVIKRRAGRSMQASTFTSMIRRNNDSHRLVIRGNRVRLRQDILVDILTRRHKAVEIRAIENKRMETPSKVRNAARRRVQE